MAHYLYSIEAHHPDINLAVSQIKETEFSNDLWEMPNRKAVLKIINVWKKIRGTGESDHEKYFSIYRRFDYGGIPKKISIKQAENVGYRPKVKSQERQHQPTVRKIRAAKKKMEAVAK